MTEKAKDPFIFKTQFSLVMMTGIEARDLAELSRCLKVVPDSSVYYHTHHFLQQHQFLTPEPPNDFAYWVSSVLQEDEVGERLASMDTVRFNSLASLRQAILDVLDSHLKRPSDLRHAPKGEEFHFMSCVIFSLPTRYQALDLKEFLDGLTRVSIHCLYNHIFVARMRPPVGVSDFSNWLANQLNEVDLARKIERLDPYTHTMEGLRKRIVSLVEHRLGD